MTLSPVLPNFHISTCNLLLHRAVSVVVIGEQGQHNLKKRAAQIELDRNVCIDVNLTEEINWLVNWLIILF